METKPDYKVSMLDELKRQAREREEEREASAMEHQNNLLHARTRRNNSLTDFLKSAEPYASLFAAGIPVTVGDEQLDYHRNDLQVIVSFRLPDHAEIQARFVWEKNDGDIPGYWEHQGFLTNKGYEYAYWTADTNKMWRVLEWTGTEYEPEGETYYASYKDVNFGDLGDALLHAERAYRDPADIQREVEDHNRAAADRPITPAKEPDIPLGEQIAALIRALVCEEIARQYVG